MDPYLHHMTNQNQQTVSCGATPLINILTAEDGFRNNLLQHIQLGLIQPCHQMTKTSKTWLQNISSCLLLNNGFGGGPNTQYAIT